MRAWIFVPILLAFLVTGASCSSQHSESLELSDRIVDAAMRLKQGGPAEIDVSYVMTVDGTSLIAVVPASGVDRAAFPNGATEEQIAGVLSSAEAWPRQALLAVVWSEGVSSGTSISRHVSVSKQLSVLKSSGAVITVALMRDSSGDVSIEGLR